MAIMAGGAVTCVDGPDFMVVTPVFGREATDVGFVDDDVSLIALVRDASDTIHTTLA